MTVNLIIMNLKVVKCWNFKFGDSKSNNFKFNSCEVLNLILSLIIMNLKVVKLLNFKFHDSKFNNFKFNGYKLNYKFSNH